MVHPATRHLTELLTTSAKVDAATELFKLKPSSTDVGPYSDAATEVFALTPSAVELAAHVYTDTAIETYKLTPSGVDIRTSVDAGTELFHFTPDADEHYCPQKVEFEGDLNSRWEAASGVKWPATMTSRWEGQFLGIGEGFAC